MFKVGDNATASDVSKRQARRDLAELEAWGLIQQQGKGPATAYVRSPSLRVTHQYKCGPEVRRLVRPVVFSIRSGTGGELGRQAGPGGFASVDAP